MSLSQIARIKSIPYLAVTDAGGDYSPTVYRIEFNLADPHFKDLRVRQAVARAIDRQAIIKIAFLRQRHPPPGARSAPT